MPFDSQLRSPRVPVSCDATLDDGQRTLPCQMGNLSRTGALVFPEPGLSMSRFLRLRVTLPGQGDCLELETFQVREAREHARPGWGLRFIGPLASGQARIDVFVEGKLAPDAPGHGASRSR